ncbi:DNA-binding protein Fis [Rhodoferax lithotrophicus]|uniref:Putative Fis-like DNA-binding protein n=1 Tax=Rhodoferax lithotrophicus TaxID=2798804 RepID=A0ABN6D207_9BURK|nr:helix-turn-helix domain-containing protein [Rhodoferax sp. MIZ03]BCO26027.1 DNA-binding protein Fis [Rhodoferax sp. MIZ03]
MKPLHIADAVRSNLEDYLKDLGQSEPNGMYDMLVAVVEKPLLEVVMQRTDHNQSKAAQWLGLNRNTLRKKLLEHKLIN